MSRKLSPPEPLSDRHILDNFQSGEEVLDQWLKRRARTNQMSGASRTYVACEQDTVFGFYALVLGSVVVQGAHSFTHFRSKRSSSISRSHSIRVLTIQ